MFAVGNTKSGYKSVYQGFGASGFLAEQPHTVSQFQLIVGIDAERFLAEFHFTKMYDSIGP